MPPNLPSKHVASPRAAWRFAPCKHSHFSRKILNPSRNEILDTPLHTINNCYPIEFILEKRCIKCLHSCLSSDNLVISNVAKSSCDNCYSTFGDNVRYFSHKYNIASKKWMEPFTDLLPCLFDHMLLSDIYLELSVLCLQLLPKVDVYHYH